MSTVEDLVSCPQCSGWARYTFETRGGHESLFCERCGYTLDTTTPPARPGYGVLSMELEGTPVTIHRSLPGDVAEQEAVLSRARCDDRLVWAAVRRAPHYRYEYLRGEPSDTSPLTLEERRALDAALEPYGEQVQALLDGALYTRSASQPGLKCFTLWRIWDGCELGRPDAFEPFLTLRAGRVTIESSAAEEIRLA